MAASAEPPTVPTTPAAPTPVHRRLSSLTLVFVGGSVGVAIREALSLVFPPVPGGIPWVVLAINVTGAFLLGFLLDALARSGPDAGHRRRLRLLLGTGLLGGYTTYSGLATDTATLLGGSTPAAGPAYALATVLLGALATGLGIVLATLTQRGRRTR
ncbi:Fluc/FEX family fluoride channel [Granulicoccus phenolivorans]|uniref:Fluc/FEX family fluoride channel n=1 Tax=Granulicoccus phenolivorans TaxID=266854 RepID=UPI000417041D|nr:CrcB family protein [Granulicoccus phenolivorans]